LDSAISGLNLGEYYTRAGSILIMPPSRGVEVGSWDVTPWAGPDGMNMIYRMVSGQAGRCDAFAAAFPATLIL
jgi:hypothetical protein